MRVFEACRRSSRRSIATPRRSTIFAPIACSFAAIKARITSGSLNIISGSFRIRVRISSARGADSLISDASLVASGPGYPGASIDILSTLPVGTGSLKSLAHASDNARQGSHACIWPSELCSRLLQGQEPPSSGLRPIHPTRL